jgi:hypothetical protein
MERLLPRHMQIIFGINAASSTACAARPAATRSSFDDLADR